MHGFFDGYCFIGKCQLGNYIQKSEITETNMAKVSMETILNTTADDAWKIISYFRGIIKYIPAIVNSTIDGTGAASVRTLILDDGSRVVEKLESIEESISCSLTYSIVSSSLPIENYFATVQVRDIDNSHCKLVWSSSFAPKGIPDTEAVEIIRNIYSKVFRRLENLYGS
jgi:hypothetical protein